MPRKATPSSRFEKSLIADFSQNSILRNDLLRLAEKVKHLEPDGLLIQVKKSKIANPYFVLKRLAEYNVRDKNTMKNWVTVSILFFLGLRESEFTLLKPEDFVFSRKIVYVWTLKQREKSRDTIPLEHVPDSVLEVWEKVIYKIDKLFNVNRRTVYHRVSSFFGTKMNPHSLRHSLGLFLYEITKDIKLVQEILRHKNIANTSIYTEVSKRHLREKLREVIK